MKENHQMIRPGRICLRLSAEVTLARLPNQQSVPRPFLKWVGGKRSSLHVLKAAAPHRFRRYFEPFLGGAAMFLAVAQASDGPEKRFHLSDINTELVDTYNAVRDVVDEVISELKKHRYDKEYYYRIREIQPSSLPLAERAARMIYLNRTGFNGLYRVNRSGRFNVPMGRYKDPVICDEVNLRACSEYLKRAEVRSAPFQDAVASAQEGDFVYFDPPYVPVSETAKFVSYAQDGFGLAQQGALADLFERLDRRGVLVLLSNSDTPWVRERFSSFRIHKLNIKRRINSKASDRGAVGEVLVVGDTLSNQEGVHQLSP